MSALYAVLFSDGLVKVGRTANPAKRIESHRQVLAAVGVTVLQSFSMDCIGSESAAEARLVEDCAKSASERRCREWFIGLEFERVVAAMREACTEPSPALEVVVRRQQQYIVSEDVALRKMPTLSDVRARLQKLTIRQLGRLEELSGVSRHTMYKMRSGEILEPSFVKVADFWPHIAAAEAWIPPASEEPASPASTEETQHAD